MYIDVQYVIVIKINETKKQVLCHDLTFSVAVDFFFKFVIIIYFIGTFLK